MSATSTIPPRCPECGRLTADNKRHCKPEDVPGNASFWARHCLTVTCACGVTYSSTGHYPRRSAS